MNPVSDFSRTLLLFRLDIGVRIEQNASAGGSRKASGAACV